MCLKLRTANSGQNINLIFDSHIGKFEASWNLENFEMLHCKMNILKNVLNYRSGDIKLNVIPSSPEPEEGEADDDPFNTKFAQECDL